MMGYKNIEFEKVQNVARITLNRPEVKNALDVPILKDMAEAVEIVRRDPEIKALIITGKGNAFSSGGDVQYVLREMCPNPLPEIRDELKTYYGGAALSLRYLEKPVIGAINGPCLGAGFDLSQHFDIRIASEKASFGSIWVRVGTIPALGGMFLLPRIIGLGRAAEMIFTGEVIDVQEAYRIGFVNKIVPAEQLQEKAMDLAKRLADGPGVAISLAKQGIHRGLSGNFAGEVDWAIYMQSLCFKTEDCVEGMTAFKEKRKPKFKGR